MTIGSKLLRVSGAILFGLSCAIPAQVSAQAYQCRIPSRVSVPDVPRDGSVRRSAVTGYTLALSWSPEFCKMREDSARHARQCSGRSGRFGLIVHGLWPAGDDHWPQWCESSRPSPSDLNPNLCMTPSARLLVRQWEKHGSCMTRNPRTYFSVTRILFNGLRIPDYDRVSREDELTAGIIRTRFVDANRGWFAEAVGVHLNERGWLEELRLCYDGRFMPRKCDHRRFGAANAAPAKIWRGL